MSGKSSSLLAAGVVSAALCASVMTSASAEPPKRILLFPFGTHQRRDNPKVTYTLRDRAHAQAVVAATKARMGGVDFNIDYDHQAVFATTSEVGGQSKASGWGSEFEIDDTGIWMSDTQWTPAAAASLRDREYRYISPYFLHDKKGHLDCLLNAALVNRPALELGAIASETSHQENDMKAIALALGLAEDADEATCVAAVAHISAVYAKTCAALSIAPDQVDDAGLVAAVASLKATGTTKVDPTKFVPIEAFEELRTSIASITDKSHADAVDDAVASGKLSPALKQWGLDLIKADPVKFAAYCASAPVLSGGKVQLANIDPKDIALDDDDKAVCAMLGVSEADYLENRKKGAA